LKDEKTLPEKFDTRQILIAFIAVVFQGNQGVYETAEGMCEYEIFFLSSFRFCRIHTFRPFGSASTVGLRRTLGRHRSIHVTIWRSSFPGAGHP
jgi:hypothetical protein